jgi:hypothetical protein
MHSRNAFSKDALPNTKSARALRDARISSRNVPTNAEKKLTKLAGLSVSEFPGQQLMSQHVPLTKVALAKFPIGMWLDLTLWMPSSPIWSNDHLNIIIINIQS